MSFCPHCGEEIKEKVSYCPKCGELLDTERPERTTLTDHIRHAVDVLRDNPFTFVPQFILTLASAIGSLFFSKFYGEDVMLEIQEAIMAGGDLTPYYPLFRIAAGFIVASMIFDLLFQPFLQHVYLDVATEEGVDMKRSLDRTMARLGELITAQLAVIAVPVVILAGVWGLLSVGTPDDAGGLWGLGFLVMIALLVLIYFLSLGTQIMVWEGERFRPSVSLGLEFFQSKLGMLITLGVINMIIGLILASLPLNQYYSFIVDVFNSVVTIDIYLNWRKE